MTNQKNNPIHHDSDVDRLWLDQQTGVFAQIENAMKERLIHPTQTLVLLPYKNLMKTVLRYWARWQPNGFMPRFTTVPNWVEQLENDEPSGDEITHQIAKNTLIAQSLLERAGLKNQVSLLTSPLVESADQLFKAMSVVSLDQRETWAAFARQAVLEGLDAPVLQLEAACTRIALEWAISSTPATDALLKSIADQKNTQNTAFTLDNQGDDAIDFDDCQLNHSKNNSLANQPNQQNQSVQLLVILEGVHPDLFNETLRLTWEKSFPNATLSLSLPNIFDDFKAINPNQNQVYLHACPDFEEEAERASTLVLQAIENKQIPVALVAIDRTLTRRINAMLHQRRVSVRDESGWMLSTTRAGLHLMTLLRAARWNCNTQTMLDWLKNCPKWSSDVLNSIEWQWRRLNINDWRQALRIAEKNHQQNNELMNEPSNHLDKIQKTLEQTNQIWAFLKNIEQIRQLLASSKSLSDWFRDLRKALEESGQWNLLENDAAGLQLIQALYLDEDHQNLWHIQTQNTLWANKRMDLMEFTNWVNQTLENTQFRNDLLHQANEQVVILPIQQLLARTWGAVILAGCDEQRLPSAPDPVGHWSKEQRTLLHLPSRETSQQTLAAAWHYATQMPHVYVLWRTSDPSGEPLLPSTLVQALLAQKNLQDNQNHPKTVTIRCDTSVCVGANGVRPNERDVDLNGANAIRPYAEITSSEHLQKTNPNHPTKITQINDPRTAKKLNAITTKRPQPKGNELPLTRWSASLYEDLRRCPYRFFALHQLNLQAAGELESNLDQRDIGLWLHTTLQRFHQLLSRDHQADDLSRREVLMNEACEFAKEKQNFSPDEFLPFGAAWLQIRQNYLNWLSDYEHKEGGAWQWGERWLERAHANVQLVGQIDRLDQMPRPNGESVSPVLVMDYKTESVTSSKKRVESATEDTQLAFYAALLSAPEFGLSPETEIRAAYLSISERNAAELIEQPLIIALRDLLLKGIQNDIERINQGAVLPALGDGSVCDYCQVRGLCRKDFW